MAVVVAECALRQLYEKQDPPLPSEVASAFRPVLMHLFCFLEDHNAMETGVIFRVTEGMTLVSIEMQPFDFAFCFFTLGLETCDLLLRSIRLADLRWEVSPKRDAPLCWRFNMDANSKKRKAPPSDALNHRGQQRARCVKLITDEEDDEFSRTVRPFSECWASFEKSFSQQNDELRLSITRKIVRLKPRVVLAISLVADSDHRQNIFVDHKMFKELQFSVQQAHIELRNFQLSAKNRTVSYELTPVATK